MVPALEAETLARIFTSGVPLDSLHQPINTLTILMVRFELISKCDLKSTRRDVVAVGESNLHRLPTPTLVFVAAVDALALLVAQELQPDALAAGAAPLLQDEKKNFS